MIKKILVTGSSGTIGTRLCELLMEKGYDVTGVDIKPNKWNKDLNKMTVLADLREKNSLMNLKSGFDLVIHLAANARVYNLVVDPSMARDNFETLFNTLEFARTNGVKRFMFASSREVYGNSVTQIVHTEHEAYVKNCESPYTASKIGGEALVHSYNQCYDMDFIITRFSNVYGRYDDSDRVIPLFIKRTKENKDLTVFGKEKLLDFTYIDDCVAGIILCIENFEDVKNDCFNIASGVGKTLIEAAEIVQKKMKSNTNLIIKDNRTGEVVHFIANILKAKNKLNYEPKVDLKKGIHKAIEWHEKNDLHI